MLLSEDEQSFLPILRTTEKFETTKTTEEYLSCAISSSNEDVTRIDTEAAFSCSDIEFENNETHISLCEEAVSEVKDRVEYVTTSSNVLEGACNHKVANTYKEIPCGDNVNVNMNNNCDDTNTVYSSWDNPFHESDTMSKWNEKYSSIWDLESPPKNDDVTHKTEIADENNNAAEGISQTPVEPKFSPNALPTQCSNQLSDVVDHDIKNSTENLTATKPYWQNEKTQAGVSRTKYGPRTGYKRNFSTDMPPSVGCIPKDVKKDIWTGADRCSPYDYLHTKRRSLYKLTTLTEEVGDKQTYSLSANVKSCSDRLLQSPQENPIRSQDSIDEIDQDDFRVTKNLCIYGKDCHFRSCGDLHPSGLNDVSECENVPTTLSATSPETADGRRTKYGPRIRIALNNAEKPSTPSHLKNRFAPQKSLKMSVSPGFSPEMEKTSDPAPGTHLNTPLQRGRLAGFGRGHRIGNGHHPRGGRDPVKLGHSQRWEASSEHKNIRKQTYVSGNLSRQEMDFRLEDLHLYKGAHERSPMCAKEVLVRKDQKYKHPRRRRTCYSTNDKSGVPHHHNEDHKGSIHRHQSDQVSLQVLPTVGILLILQYILLSCTFVHIFPETQWKQDRSV